MNHCVQLLLCLERREEKGNKKRVIVEKSASVKFVDFLSLGLVVVLLIV